jgi:O-antigen biosynthesis protein WbqP
MKRIFDLFISLCLAPVVFFPILIIAVLVRLTSRGPALYWSDRVGVGNEIFQMPKFRTMRIDTPAVATHLLSDPDRLSPRAFVGSATKMWVDLTNGFVWPII